MKKFKLKEDKSITEKALAKLRSIRISMSATQSSNANNSFYAFLAMSCTLIPDYSVPTLGINGKKLYFNPWFICGYPKSSIINAKKELDEALSNGEIDNSIYDSWIKRLDNWYGKKSEAELTFFWRHELEHIIRDGLGRKRGLGIDMNDKKKHDLINIAQDYIINNCNAVELHKDINSAKKALPVLEYLYTNPKYLGWTTEQVYIDLLKKENENQDDDKDLLDEHYELTDEEIEDITDTIIKAAKSAGQSGTPKDVWKVVEELFAPKIKWSNLLDQQVKSTMVRDETYEIPHMRSRYMTGFCRDRGYISQNQHLVFPSEEVDGKIKVVLAFDTSGSISKEEKLKMLSEAAGIIKQFSDYELAVFCWGSDVVNDSLKYYDPSNIKELYSYEFLAGGGTNILPVINTLTTKFNSYQSVIFTDGYFFDKIPEDKSVKSLSNSIWTLFDNKSFKSPIGKTVHYESEK